MWRLNAFIIGLVQLMQSWIKEFHLSTARLLNAYIHTYFICHKVSIIEYK